MFIKKRLGPKNFKPNEGEGEGVTNNVPNDTPIHTETQAGETLVVQPVQPIEHVVDPAKKKTIRCKKWPVCKNESCDFAHPKETCPYFPKCAFGDKCLYIHPNIPCKFGYYCTRVGCAYSHPTGYMPGHMNPHMQWGQPKFKNMKVDYGKNKSMIPHEKLDKPDEAKEETEVIQTPTQP